MSIEIDQFYDGTLSRDDLSDLIQSISFLVSEMEIIHKDDFVEGFLPVADDDEEKKAWANSIQLSDYIAKDEVDRILKTVVYKRVSELYSEFDPSIDYELEFSLGADQIYFKLESII